MNTVEERLRAATQAAAGTVAPGSAPPLHLPNRPDRRPGIRRPPSRSGWPRWVAPLAAAASVIAVVAASLVITSGPPHGQTGSAAASRRTAMAVDRIPPFYLTFVGGRGGRQHVVIHSTATGVVLATILPPRPYGNFSLVTAAEDDRTFVLAAQRWRQASPTKLFLLRLDTGARVQRLTPLPIPAIPAAEFTSAIAISPDASKLAMAVEQAPPRNDRNPEIRVFTLATGAERTWVWPGRATITNNGGTGQSLSWTADGRTLAFQEWVGGGIEIRLLDTTAPGNDLRASRLALNFAHEQESLHFVHGKARSIFGFSAIITPDGTKIVLATVTETKPPIKSELAFTEFSTTTGRAVRVLGRWRFNAYPGQTQDVLWTSPSGSKLIVVAHKPGAGTITRRTADYPIEIGVLAGNTFTPLHGAPPANTPAGWPVW
jgi:hypothetical protein